MKHRAWPVLLVFLSCLGCTDKDAFQARRLILEPNVVFERGALQVTGRTNLPDGFTLYVQVEAAPDYGAQAVWAGECRVGGGSFFAVTTFGEPLPFRTTLIVSPALNPDYIKAFSQAVLPFVVDSKWKPERSAQGVFQVRGVVERTFGTQADHRAVLGPALEELETSLTTMRNEIKTLDTMATDPSYGFARFGRLHAQKRRKLHLDAWTTSFYYPKSFELLRRLNRAVQEYSLFVLAGFEKDAAERDVHAKARGRVDRRMTEADEAIEKLKKLLGITGQSKQDLS